MQLSIMRVKYSGELSEICSKVFHYGRKYIFLRVQMAAGKEGKFQRRIFSPFFRRFHYAYNILDGRRDYVKKKEEEEEKRKT